MKFIQKSVLLSYDKYQRLLNRPITTPTSQTGGLADIETLEHVETSKDSGLTISEILEVIPKRYRSKVEAILTFTSRDPNDTIGWNSKGELIYKGSTILGSHIVDLLKDTQYQHKSYTPVGATQFYQGLKELHIPVTLIVKSDITLRPPGRPVEKKERQPRKKWIHV